MMICIAILAIVSLVGAHRCSAFWLLKESDYRFALRNGRYQIAALRTADFHSLPPQVVKVGRDGWVQLAHQDLVPDSVSAGDLVVKQVDLAAGRVQLESVAGVRAVVDYSYYVADEGEAHTVPAEAPFQVQLRNVPALQIRQVRLVEGEKSRVLSPSSCRLENGALQLPPECAGKVIEVDYTGAAIRNQVSGGFLTADLQPSLKPGPCKLMKVRESYGRNGVGRIELSLVKAGDGL